MRSAATFFAVLAMTGAASAACMENLGISGCTDLEVFPRSDLAAMSCENLWYLRNLIYDENGLCFKTDRAKAAFDNTDCWIDEPAQVKLNSFEQNNVLRIRDIEKQKSCPR